MRINCIAVDDERKALELIELYCKKVPFLELDKCFRDALEALDYLPDNTIDLIFLDINMPDLNGIEFIQSLSKPPMIIFTTAYSEYAVESYEYKAVDYLLKPITFSRFLKASNRALDQLKVQKEDGNTVKALKSDHVIIKSGSESHKVNCNKILFIEGAQNYVFVHTPEQKIMTLMRMKAMEDMLCENDFIRIHKSFIINYHHLEKIESHQVTINGNKIPIGTIYRESFRKQLTSFQGKIR